MKFISIDSSLANTGVAIGIIDSSKKITAVAVMLIETEKTKNKQVRASSDTIQRCRATYRFLRDLIDDYKPDFIFAETPSGSQSASGMKSYGATCQLIGTLSPSPIEVTPDEVKVASVNDKKASKEKIIEWAHSNYPNAGWIVNKSTGKLQNKNEHMADAVAVVYAGIKTDEFLRVFAIVGNK
jgi:Holliday junction resolvasome RuvABC endonuclease subunit